MKTKMFLAILIILLACSCSKKVDRKSNIENMLIDKMVKKEYIDKKNLKSFAITRVYVYGYYKSDESKKDMEVDFDFECIDKTRNCVKKVASTKKETGSIIWIKTDEKKIYRLSNGISINKDDIDSGNYIRVNEIIN